MRSEFDVYKKDVEIKTSTGVKNYSLYPLSGRFFPRFMNIVTKLSKLEDSAPEDADEQTKTRLFLEGLDEDTVSKLHTLVFETLKYSLDVKDKKELEQLDMFVSQNLFQFVQPLVEVNTPSESEQASNS